MQIITHIILSIQIDLETMFTMVGSDSAPALQSSKNIKEEKVAEPPRTGTDHTSNPTLAPQVQVIADTHLSPSSSAPAFAMGRPRSSTVNSHTSTAGSGYESSSGDSMLSFWSSDDSDSDSDESATEPDSHDEPVPKAKSRPKADIKELEKGADKKKREEDRQKVLEQAGLKLRREPPSVPGVSVSGSSSGSAAGPGVGRRRAPAAPGKGKKRRAAPGVPPGLSTTKTRNEEEESGEGGKLDTLDAYARYENYLAQSQRQQQQQLPRPTPSALPRPISPSSSTATLPLPPLPDQVDPAL
jgi:hypothetical protein